MTDGRLSLGVLLALLAVLPSCTSILRATRDRDHEAVARLIRAGKDPNEKESRPDDKLGPTPLFEAIALHDLALVEILVEGGANVNLESNCEKHIVTPLQKAALHGDVAIVRYLLSKGADPKGLGEGDNVLEWLAWRPDAGSAAERKAIVHVVLQHVETKLGAEKARELLDGQTPSALDAAHAGDVPKRRAAREAAARARSVGDGARQGQARRRGQRRRMASAALRAHPRAPGDRHSSVQGGRHA